jgi:hypothetical protein
MFSRGALSLAISFAILVAPTAPIEITHVFSPKKNCCAHTRTNADPCHGCPISSGGTTAGSTCCSVQAPCFVSCVNGSDEFVAGMSSAGFAFFTNDRVTSRVQRPPVPPPRIQFS